MGGVGVRERQGSGGGGSRAPWWESLGRKGREKAGTASHYGRRPDAGPLRLRFAAGFESPPQSHLFTPLPPKTLRTTPQSPPPPLPCLSPTTLSLFPSRTSTFLEGEKTFLRPFRPLLNLIRYHPHQTPTLTNQPNEAYIFCCRQKNGRATFFYNVDAPADGEKTEGEKRWGTGREVGRFSGRGDGS